MVQSRTVEAHFNGCGSMLNRRLYAVTLPKFAFFQGKIVPYSEAKVGVMTHALNYGTGAFAGLRGYWNPEQEIGRAHV